MLDLGWTELLLIGIVALIVVGPKDLPGMFRAVGNFVGKAKRMARDFSQAMNDAADDAGVSDLQKSLKAASNPMSSAMDEVKKSTESFTAKTMAGPAKTAELDPERAEAAEKIRKKSTEMAQERQAKEKAADEAAKAQDAAKPKTKKAPAQKAPAQKASAKTAPAQKTAAKKPAAKKPATRKTPAKKPAAKSAEARKAAPGKSATGSSEDSA